MQYDPNENIGSIGGTAGAGGASTGGSFGGSDFATDRAEPESTLNRAGDTAKDKLGQAREKASDMKATLADKLEAGAHKLRERRQGSASGVSGAEGSQYGAQSDATLDRATQSLATGMESTANWVRNADLNQMRTNVEQQVKSNPGRALLVAVGVGYVLGKILRGGGGNRM
jgi:ElaB/YqjD/DUF883 family membrane-anchored ribosome-binding protein